MIRGLRDKLASGVESVLKAPQLLLEVAAV